jgi:hypothetical protein
LVALVEMDHKDNSDILHFVDLVVEVKMVAYH